MIFERRKRLAAVLAAAAFSTVGFAQTAAKSVEMPVIVLEGTPSHRGLKHGRVLREQIVKAVRAWKASLTLTYGMHPEEFVRKFYRRTEFTKQSRSGLPDFYRRCVAYPKARV